jgi:hypothetical protein
MADKFPCARLFAQDDPGHAKRVDLGEQQRFLTPLFSFFFDLRTASRLVARPLEAAALGQQLLTTSRADNPSSISSGLRERFAARDRLPAIPLCCLG